MFIRLRGPPAAGWLEQFPGREVTSGPDGVVHHEG